MTLALKLALIAHVGLGLLGTMAFFLATIQFKRLIVSVRSLMWSTWSGFFFFFLSWITGGYYYVAYYGSSVKPVIKAGPAPWAHSVIMETKEHLFLLLPFLSLVVALAVWSLGGDLDQRPRLKKSLAGLSQWILILAVLMSVGGTIISSAVRK